MGSNKQKTRARTHNILFVRMRVYLVGPMKTRTVNYLMQRTYQHSAKYTIWKNAHAHFPNLLSQIKNK